MGRPSPRKRRWKELGLHLGRPKSGEVEKYKALLSIARDFEDARGREPVFWIDAYCIDQANIASSLKFLPVFVVACEQVVVLYGPSYFGRLWCCWELFVLHAVHASGFASVIFWSIAARKLVDVLSETKDFRVADTGCYTEADRGRISAVIDTFKGGVKGFESEMRQLAVKVVQSGLGMSPREIEALMSVEASAETTSAVVEASKDKGTGIANAPSRVMRVSSTIGRSLFTTKATPTSMV